jgi:adenylate cyclase
MNAPRLTFVQKSSFTKTALACGVAILVLFLTHEGGLGIGALRRIELATIDYRFQVRGPHPLPPESTHVVIVEIADESFKSLPEKFPWPRSYYAHALRNLKAAGARVIGIDLIFSGPDDFAARNDSIFRAAVREVGSVVLAGERGEDQLLFRMTSARQDFDNIFTDTGAPAGLVNIRPDADGIYRLYNFFYLVDTPGGASVPVPTFGFAVLNAFTGLRAGTSPQPAEDGFLYHGMTIPTYDPGSMLINYYGPDRTFPHVKFHDVIDDETFVTREERESGEPINTFSDPDYGYLTDQTFRDKIVLIGVTMPEYKDLFPVSIGRGQQKGDNLMYGVEIHANIIENVLRGDFLRKQSGASQAFLTIGLVILAFFATSWLKGLRIRHQILVEVYSFAVAVVLMAGVACASILLFTLSQYVLHMTSALVAVAGGYGASTVYHLVAERKQRLLIKSMFSTYVNPSLVEELVEHPERLVLGGKREELTVLFSDIEGFTTISQSLQPENLVSLLNEYLSVMSEIIFRHDGTLDKYEGDAIMAFWGAPIPQIDHAIRACTSALEMQQAVRGVNEQWRREGKPTFRIRVGVNTGTMIVGNMGATGKFNYTVIGDSVNLASRLEGANKEYKTGIMVSERTFSLVENRILGRELDRIAVKGRSQPVTVFELIRTLAEPIRPAEREFLDFYTNAMGLYYRMQWKQSATLFTSALRLRPEDYPTQLHLNRIEAYQTAPPAGDWDGVFVLTSK